MGGNSPENGAYSSMLGHAGIVALVGIVLALIGAFGTHGVPFGWRLLYWIGGLLAALAVLEVLVIVTRQSARLAGLPPFAAYLLAVPLLAGLIVLLLGLSGLGMEAVTPALFLQSAALGVAIFALFFVLNMRRPDDVLVREPAAAASAAAVPSPGLLDSALHTRLAPAFGPILALGIEDHYTIVHGQGPRAMLLISLSDAILEAGSSSGVQVHRSWWVAHGAVETAHREGRNVALELLDGTRVPVSRANVAAVRRAGWL